MAKHDRRYIERCSTETRPCHLVGMDTTMASNPPPPPLNSHTMDLYYKREKRGESHGQTHRHVRLGVCNASQRCPIRARHQIMRETRAAYLQSRPVRVYLPCDWRRQSARKWCWLLPDKKGIRECTKWYHVSSRLHCARLCNSLDVIFQLLMTDEEGISFKVFKMIEILMWTWQNYDVRFHDENIDYSYMPKHFSLAFCLLS